MKIRLNLTIEEKLLDTMKRYAHIKQTSISELVEDYFRSITKTGKRRDIFKEVDKLKKPAIDDRANLKELFYLDQAKKYGF
jgi:Family of unknown function (DUF6364)